MTRVELAGPPTLHAFEVGRAERGAGAGAGAVRSPRHLPRRRRAARHHHLALARRRRHRHRHRHIRPRSGRREPGRPDTAASVGHSPPPHRTAASRPAACETGEVRARAARPRRCWVILRCLAGCAAGKVPGMVAGTRRRRPRTVFALSDPAGTVPRSYRRSPARKTIGCPGPQPARPWHADSAHLARRLIREGSVPGRHAFIPSPSLRHRVCTAAGLAEFGPTEGPARHASRAEDKGAQP